LARRNWLGSKPKVIRIPKIGNIMNRVVVGITGASGILYGIRLLEVLKEFDVEVHLTCSSSASLVNKHEGDGRSWDEVLAIADVVHDNGNLAASIASGSFKAKAMAIVPCSGTTLGKLAAGISDNLVTRAALVMLKERRQLILVPRETPLSTIYIDNMLKLSNAGAIIAPASPAFYNKPKTLDDNVNFIVGRVLDLLGYDSEIFSRWEGSE
jgi:4-hydroxy-3-polyprenylbenzoate decarboxylase